MSFLQDSNIVVGIAFVCFIGVLLYAGAPKIVTDALDKRAEKIREELDEAHRLREEAQTLLAGYERKAREVGEHADAIVAQAREDAETLAAEASASLDRSIARRLQAAEDQIAAAEAGAVKEVKDKAVAVAMAAAADVMAAGMTKQRAGAMIDASIEEVGRKLH